MSDTSTNRVFAALLHEFEKDRAARGTILDQMISLEAVLDEVLVELFEVPVDRKDLFLVTVLGQLNLDRKIDAFRTIATSQGWSVKDLAERLKRANNIRNLMAHAPASRKRKAGESGFVDQPLAFRKVGRGGKVTETTLTRAEIRDLQQEQVKLFIELNAVSQALIQDKAGTTRVRRVDASGTMITEDVLRE